MAAWQGGAAVSHSMHKRRTGLAIVGLGGAVGSTVAAGLHLIRSGESPASGLPLAGRPLRGAPGYDDLAVAGWDLDGSPLSAAVLRHRVLTPELAARAEAELSRVTPWPAFHNSRYCRPMRQSHVMAANSLRAAVAQMREDLDRFQDQRRLDSVVVVNLGSTERAPDPASACLTRLDAFEEGLDRNDPDISAGMLYAYAAAGSGRPFVNFTPSQAADLAPIEALARAHGAPLAGKDGKTGQTLVKTALAPALRDRALRVEGWYSTNLLGNLDGYVLDDPQSRASKIGAKRSVLDQILGYTVDNHIINICYHPPKGDMKEAWDSIDLSGFLGQPMQMKINFLCADSILAAPLVIELARLSDIALQRGLSGCIREFAVFFKSPQGFNGAPPEHAFHAQQAMLDAWLARYAQ
jgi:myo-inositol-1-phosphate synthase